MNLPLLALDLCTFAVTVALVRYLSSPRAPFQVLDHPNARSLHSRPTPRSGGVGIAASLLMAALVLSFLHPPPPYLAELAFGFGVLAAVGLWDDLADVPPVGRLAVHLLAAGTLVAGGVSLQTISLPGWEVALAPGLDGLLTVLLTVWLINLFNFMDGMDGLAGGMAVFGFGGLALLLVGSGWFAGFLGLVAMAAGGFLVWNLPRARIFMGDLGSSLLGFLAALSLLRGQQQGWLPIWAGLLLFSPFVYDASVTLLRRLLRGERVWEAHRGHHYQRLVLAGWAPPRVLLGAYLLMAACLVSVWWALGQGPAAQWLLLAGWSAGYLGMTLGTERLARGRPPEAAA